MLRHYQRFWVVLVGVLLSAPLAISMLAPENDWMLQDELRPRALLPEIPHSAREWRVLSGKLDAYLRDHFGLRRAMIHAHAALVHRMLHSGSAMVQIGSDGWLFLATKRHCSKVPGYCYANPRSPRRLRRLRAFGPLSSNAVLGSFSRRLPTQRPFILTRFPHGRAIAAGGPNTT